MEQHGFDFSGVLRILVFVAFAVIYIFKVGAKGAPTEPIGDEDEEEGERPDPFKRLLEMMQIPTQEHSDEEEQEREAETVKRRENRCEIVENTEAKASQNMAVQRAFSVEPIEKTDVEIQSSERSEIAENFDLRQAVIMSEILTPKFKED